MRETTDGRRSQNLLELSMLSDKEKQLQFQLRQTQDMLREEKNRSERYLEQVRQILHCLIYLYICILYEGAAKI